MARIIFKNASVFDGIRKLDSEHEIVIEGDRIISVSAQSTRARPDDQIVDLSGKTVIPGMTTGHWHPDYDSLTLDELVGIPLGRTKPAAYLIAMAYRNLDAVLASGVTRVIGAGCSFDIDSSFKMAIADGKFPGPRILAGSRHVNTTGNFNDTAHWWYDMGTVTNGLRYGPADVFCDGPFECAKATRMEIARGAQVIKVFTSGGHGVTAPNDRRDLTPIELAAVVEAAHDRGVLVRSHCVGRENVLSSVKAGIDIIDHGDEIDEECIDAMAKHGTAWVPSMFLVKRLLDLGILPPPLASVYRGDFDNLARTLPLADKAGVRIIPGDDFGIVIEPHSPGVYSRELQVYMRDMSLDPAMVLRWATYNGAAMFGGADEGKIQAGALADLVVVNGDPLADFGLLAEPATGIASVMIGGDVVKGALT